MARRLLPLLLLGLLLAPSVGEAQQARRARGGEQPDNRVSLTPYGAYFFEYGREARLIGEWEDPGRKEWEVPAGPGAGLAMRIGLTERIGLEGGLLFRAAESGAVVCEDVPGPQPPDCGPYRMAELLIARAGAYGTVPGLSPLSFSVTPLLARQGLEGIAKAAFVWGVAAGAAVEIPVGSPRLSAQLALDGHVIAGSRRNPGDPRYTELEGWRPIVLRAGLSIHPGAEREPEGRIHPVN